MVEEDGEKNVYQMQKLKNLEQSKKVYSEKYVEYCSKVSACIKNRLGWSDLNLIKDIITVLATQGWQKIVDMEEDTDSATDNPGWVAVENLVTRFKTPLEGADTDIDSVLPEFKTMVDYGVQFFSLSTLDYRSVWWRLFHCPTSSEWANCFSLVELLFSLPVSNGKVERVFSQLKTIKTEKRSLLSNALLDDLLQLNSDVTPLQEFNPDDSIDTWWKAKTRRLHQHKRKPYKKRATKSVSSVTTTASTSTTDISASESDTAEASETESDSFDLSDSDINSLFS